MDWPPPAGGQYLFACLLIETCPAWWLKGVTTALRTGPATACRSTCLHCIAVVCCLVVTYQGQLYVCNVSLCA